MRGFAQDSEDPLTRALAPPPNESPNEREQRLRAEAEAQRKSDQIDEVLKAERATLKKRKIMRMLLLGQSESGKSTTLKNMQLTYAPRAWAAERVSWRAVIQLNLIRSVNAILDALEVELSNNVHYQTPIHSRAASPGSPISDEDDPYELAEVHIPQESKPSLMKLKLRLGPLRQVEIDLKARLGDGTEELTESTLARSSAVMAATPFDAAPNPLQSLSTRRSKEVIVRSHQSWKDKEKERKEKDRNSVRPATTGTTDGDRDSATDVLAGCADDLLSLSSDPIVQEIVERKKVLSGLGESAEYFLGRIQNIASRDYEPSDDDVLRARIRTLGVQEYHLVFEVRHERDPWKEWTVYDVGGSRSMRRAWVPYFSDVQAILFLAPISAFDERLAEDRRINRLQDTYLLWESIVKCEILKNCTIILFMNKCDVLQRKLASGVRINEHLPSFADRTNDYATFTQYLRSKFKDLLSQHSPGRPFYQHLTSAIDAQATAITLLSVRDGILQAHLKESSFVY